jgi:hypothetical protein
MAHSPCTATSTVVALLEVLAGGDRPGSVVLELLLLLLVEVTVLPPAVVELFLAVVLLAVVLLAVVLLVVLVVVLLVELVDEVRLAAVLLLTVRLA